MCFSAKYSSLLFVVLSFVAISTAHAQTGSSSCLVPLDEKQSAPAIDLIQNGGPIDQDRLWDQIKGGFDSSTLEPQLSNLYVGKEQPLVQYANMPYPAENGTVQFVNEIGSTAGLVFNRVTLDGNPDVAYQLNFSLDVHPALARNALLRKLGYAIPSPKYYSKIKVVFPDMDTRNQTLDDLAAVVGDLPAYRFVVGGQDEIKKNNLTITFQDVVLEPAIIQVPQMHWGIFEQDSAVDTLQSRRSLRALLVPLTVLDIPQSANMYAFEAAKIYDNNINFSRENANLFSNQTTIGDARWITRKIAKLTRADWTAILQAARYPSDVQALLVEKTIGRVDQFVQLTGTPNLGFKPIAYNEYLSAGKVVKGKETQEYYDGYVQRFTYGDPQNPLRGTELAKYFGIKAISSGLGTLIDQANKYLQVITPQKYIDQHSKNFTNELISHLQNSPSTPFVEPLQVWGGPVVGGSLGASRNIVTGSYYGASKSQVQLVDQVSVSANAGLFLGVSGIPKVGISISPKVQYSRSYVHVRPINDISTAWKDRWTDLFVPTFMISLSKTLEGKPGEETDTSVSNFLSKLNVGEMFIVTDGFSGGGEVSAQIPIGEILGFGNPLTNVAVDAGVGGSYVILNRVTIARTQDGFQVYLSRIHTGAFDQEFGISYYAKLISLTNALSKGEADTKAYVFPDTFSSPDQEKLFQKSIASLIKSNNSDLVEQTFEPYKINHKDNGDKFGITLGPLKYTTRENFHELKITPPEDPAGRYNATDFTRTVIQGQITKITGTDIIGFLSSIIKGFVSWFDFGSNSVGDDPSSGYLGKSTTTAISTELEITNGKPNNTLLKVQKSHDGWEIREKRFIRLIEKMSKQIGSYVPNGGLVDSSEFSQTKKIEAYNIAWTMLVYESGIARLMSVLDIKNTSTTKALQSMVSIIGEREYEKYCKKNDLKVVVAHGPYVFDDPTNHPGQVIESSGGQTTFVGCALPWMEEIFYLRSSLESHSQFFMTDVRSEHDAKEKVRWTNRTMSKLMSNLELEEIIGLVGTDNAFFEVNVSGFRTKDERALDENFSANYFSNTIGVINQTTLTGPFSDIENTTQISSNEIEAGYLSDGY